ncbi:60S ribosomal protein L20 [Ascosphaera pollenicola]|nr:60S ribosomal protein L20 [Ascosphaera pollenicola]
MAALFTVFKAAQLSGSGSGLAQTLNPAKTETELNAIYSFTDEATAAADIRYSLLKDCETGVKLPKHEGTAWVDVYVAYWRVAGELIAVNEYSRSGSWARVFSAWRDFASTLMKGYTIGKFPAWTIPCLYMVGKYLRVFAMKADAEPQQEDAFDASFQDDLVTDSGKNANLEETSRIINRMFTLCLQDRSPIEESRKWGVYYIANLSFKTFFKLGSISSCRSLLHAIEATQFDMPPLENFPKSHIVTYKYFVGLMAFLEEKYVEVCLEPLISEPQAKITHMVYEQAEEHLTYAFRLCHRDSYKNKEYAFYLSPGVSYTLLTTIPRLILSYLIPCHIVTTHTLPSKTLLTPYPRLEYLFLPLCQCIKRGDLSGFDAAMTAGENEFVKRKIYLPLERGRDLALRNLYRKVFLAGGFDPPVNGQPAIRRTRIPVAEFAAAMRLGRKPEEEQGVELDMDEVECLLANLMYKVCFSKDLYSMRINTNEATQNLMKGYISRERSMVVLSKGGAAFPGTGV